MPFCILSINPGSTSTKLAIYRDETPVFVKNIQHTPEELAPFDNLLDQFAFRKGLVLEALLENGVAAEEISAVVGRGGLLPPVKAGGYHVNQAMLDALKQGRQHASNLGAYLALRIAEPLGIPAYIYDAVASDEFGDLARPTGFPGVNRRSLAHVLNAKAAARKVAAQLGGSYQNMNFVVCHMGGGISTTVHEKGRIVDIVNDDEGAYSPERSGRMPIEPIIDLSQDMGMNRKQILDKVKKQSGLMGHLGTNDCQDILRRIEAGDEKAKFYFDTMIYQLAKDIGSLAPVVCGKLDAVILTGGIAYSNYVTEGIRKRVESLAPFVVMAGENEMESLTLGALRMLRGEEECHEFA